MKTALGLALLLPLLTGCDRLQSRGEENDEAPVQHDRLDEQGRVALSDEEVAVLDLATAEAEAGTLTTSRLRFGIVVARPQEDVLVAAPVTGRLAAPAVARGDTIAEGDLLVELEPLVDSASRASMEAQRRELQGRIEGARAQAEAEQKNVERVAALVTSGLATETDRARAEATLRSEKARVESLRRAKGELGRMSGGRLKLLAPAAGAVTSVTAETGALVQQGAVLVRVIQAGPRWIDIAVPPADPVGTGYRVAGTSGSVEVELLTRGAVIADDGTRRDRLVAAPESAAALPPGATVSVEILDTHDGVLVPTSAVVRRDRRAVVFVEVQPHRYAPRPIQIAAQDETQTAVTAGVAAGDRVVTRGAPALLGELPRARSEDP